MSEISVSKYFVCLLFLSFFGCHTYDPSLPCDNSNSKKSKIVIIINNIPENWKYEGDRGGYSHRGKHEIEYSNNGILTNYYFSNYSGIKDTLVIKSNCETVELRHKYKGLNSFDYLLNPSDTIEFNYLDKKPIAKIRSKDKENLNFGLILDEQIHKGKPSNFVKYNAPYLFLQKEYGSAKNQVQFKAFLEQFYVNYKKRSADDFLTEKHLLDSLKKTNSISNQTYDYYKMRLHYKNKILEIRELDLIDLINYPQDDNLLRFSFYREYIDLIVQKGILINIEEKKTSSSNFKDAQVVFDSISINSQLTEGSRKYLLFHWIERIINSGSSEDIRKYFERFQSFVDDDDLVSHLKDKYKLNAPVSDDLSLVDNDGKITTFSKILKQNTGKVIYVDFWASWCAPCIKVMPNSKELREYFRNEKVAFIYLAFNDKQEKWQIESHKLGLAALGTNYFITNSKTNTMIEDLDIDYLPRYLIFNKNGILKYNRAPGLETEEIKSLINTLLQ